MSKSGNRVDATLTIKIMKAMYDKQFSKDVGSYVSFALRENLPIALNGLFDREEYGIEKAISRNAEDSAYFYDMEFASHQFEKLSKREMASIEKLSEKYSMLKKYFPSKAGLDKLEIVSGDHIEEKAAQQPGSAYRKVAVNPNQLEIAKFVAKKVEAVQAADANGDHFQARTQYNSLQDFLAKKRAELIGGFESVSEIEDSLGMHAVGTNGNPQAAMNPVIFVLIEIWVSS
jgi:hypothetical protein